MKLYDESERYTPEATEFVHEVAAALGPLFDKWIARGAPVRQLGHLAQQEVTTIELSRILQRKATK